jgi:choline dehydrogenase-like flavoprotein
VTDTFDAIVIGSGITGGWAAKELCEKGLKVLMVERGRMVEHQAGYTTETLAPWELPYRGQGDGALFAKDYSVQSLGRAFDEWTYKFFVNDREHPYQTTEKEPFQWRRGYQLGGRSLMWGRQCYRWSDLDFGANKADGHGVDWPIRYADLAPWYDHVESFIGVSGSHEGLAHLPDGNFQPPMPLNAVEKHLKQAVETRWPDRRVIIGRTANLTQEKGDRAPCQYRGICARGCSYGAYFSTQSSTLPAARATGNLTLLTDTLVERINYDPKSCRATGISTIDAKSGTRSQFQARIIFLCASTINSVAVLLRSRSEAFPTGLANSSQVLGHYLMDHAQTMSAFAKVNGFEDRTYYGNRPNNFIVPRFRNVTAHSEGAVRGYSYQSLAARHGWSEGGVQPGIGAPFKEKMHGPGNWFIAMGAFAECLPRAENRITLDESRSDPDGLAQIRIAFAHGDNERQLLSDAKKEAIAMVQSIGATVVSASDEPGLGGTSVHEMGGARMGWDPATSVLNRYNQAHDVDNLFVTDGAAMASSACQNPSLTYMALTARACSTAVSMMKEGKL